MKRFLLFAIFAIAANFVHAQLLEDFDPAPTGWTLSTGASFGTVSSNGVITTPGVGGNNPADIGTPSVNKTSSTVKVCFDIWAYNGGLNTKQPFPAQTYANVLFVNPAVTTAKDAQSAANIYAQVDSFLLSGGTNCFTFTFPSSVTASNFKVFISFYSPLTQSGIKYVIDNMSISGVSLVCGSNICSPVALPDIFNRGNNTELSFNGVLYGGNSAYPAPPAGYAVDLTGTDNDPNYGYNSLEWILLTPPVSGSTVTVNANGTFTITRNSTSVTQSTFTYRLIDPGLDGNLATTTDNIYSDATVTVNWPAASSLPVSLINFTANRSGTNVTLQWTTTIESNNTGFEIQRSIGNSAYEKVGFVATQAPGGNSGTPLFYQYKEQNNATGTSWYRLVQIDKDGTPTISTAKGVHGIDESARITVYPNPGTSGNTNVLFGSSATRDIIIADLSGKIVKHWSNYHDDNMTITGLDAGIYMLVVINKNTSEKQTQKVVIIR
jgi:hypothetical protein